MLTFSIGHISFCTQKQLKPMKRNLFVQLKRSYTATSLIFVHLDNDVFVD